MFMGTLYPSGVRSAWGLCLRRDADPRFAQRPAQLGQVARERPGRWILPLNRGVAVEQLVEDGQQPAGAPAQDARLIWRRVNARRVLRIRSGCISPREKPEGSSNDRCAREYEHVGGGEGLANGGEDNCAPNSDGGPSEGSQGPGSSHGV
jgi:hypothetical protein